MTSAEMHVPNLFTHLRLRGLDLKNRIVISPMQQYSAVDGVPGEWHRSHLSRLAMGGAGLVFVEATAVEQRGRNTHGDTGLWRDDQIAPLAALARVIRQHGAAAGIQLGHTGRKAGMQRPWDGHGRLGAQDAARGEDAWQAVGPTDEPVGPGWPVPRALTIADIREVVAGWGRAAARAHRAGFDVVEVHGGHGYLMHQFLSPLSNNRCDEYGGTLERRMRFPLEAAQAIRARWPDEKPLFWRVSAVDGGESGNTLADTATFAKALKSHGVDVVDCSSGGISGFATAGNSPPRGLGFQVGYAQAIRALSGVPTMAVGLIIGAHQADAIVREGQADLIAIGREALNNPNWPLHAALSLGVTDGSYADWPPQYGWWLSRRAAMLRKIGGTTPHEAP